MFSSWIIGTVYKVCHRIVYTGTHVPFQTVCNEGRQTEYVPKTCTVISVSYTEDTECSGTHLQCAYKTNQSITASFCHGIQTLLERTAVRSIVV